MLAAVLAALSLSACGSGSTASSTGPTQTAAGSTSATGQTQTATAGGGKQSTPAAPAGQNTGSTSTPAAPSGGAGESAGSAAGSPPKQEGGEKSIEDFGSEAQGSSRQAVLTAEHGYLSALAAGAFDQACSLLSSNVQRSLEQLAGSQAKAQGCTAILPKLLSPSAPAVARQQAGGQITKVRVKGDRAFVVFRAPGAKLYMFALSREHGAWKVTTVASSVLVPSL